MQHSTAALPCPRGVPPPPYGTKPGQKALPDGELNSKACCRLLHVQNTFRFQVIYYLLAKIGLDTAENEPSKVSMKWGSRTGVAPVILVTCSID